MVTSLVHEADAAAVDEAVSAARRALHGPWAGFTDAQRADAMRRIAEGVRSRFDEFLAAEIRDTGKPSAMARHLDIPRGAANLDVFADQIGRASGRESVCQYVLIPVVPVTLNKKTRTHTHRPAQSVQLTHNATQHSQPL